MKSIFYWIEKFFQKVPFTRTLYESILQRIVFKIFLKNRGKSIIEEKFDHLILLDACRYDFFKENNILDGQLSKRISIAPHTSGWLRKSFTKKHDDLIYISANPETAKKQHNYFKLTDYVYKIENVWKYGWDDKYKTVLPHTLREATLKVVSRYHSKRFIIHFVQPHQPFIRNGYSIGLSSISGSNNKESIFQLAKRGKIKRKEIMQYYRENLVLVLKEVKKLVNHLDGRIIITADHGEAFGEKFIWEHVPGVYTKELIEIPWLVIDKPKQRKEKETIIRKLERIKV